MTNRKKEGKIIFKLVKGDYKLPMWAAVFILVVGVALSGGYYGLKRYDLYQTRQAGKEKIINAVLLAQQEELARIKKEIEALESGRGDDAKSRDALANRLEGRLAAVVKEWQPKVAAVECRWNGLFGEEVDHGSGLWISSNNTIITSNHVVTMEDTFLGPPAKADSCTVKLPGGEAVTVKKGDISSWQGIPDIASLMIKNPSPGMGEVASSLNSVCRDKAASGDRIVVLGYPAIGAKNSVTVTEGIISGYEDNFYITSAKIEQGVSGGVAVLVDKNCYLGIPTFVRAGEVESLGRILDSTLLTK